jgi:hypothetical protein
MDIDLSMEDETTRFMNKKTFSRLIETTVFTTELSYMDAVVHICEKNNIELEDVKRYLTPSILDHLEAEARSLNFLPKLNTLDV